MKKIHFALLSAVTVLMAVPSARAQTEDHKLYAELGYTALSLKETDIPGTAKASPAMLSGIVGYQFMPHLAGELFLGFGMGKDEITYEGMQTGLNARLSNAFGVFLKPGAMVSDSVELFGRVGWAHHKVKSSGLGLAESSSDSGLAYGVGANYHLSKTSYIQANWMSYYNRNDTKATGFNLSYGMRF